MKLREGSLAALLLRLQAPAPALMGVRCKSLSELVPSARPAQPPSCPAPSVSDIGALDRGEARKQTPGHQL